MRAEAARPGDAGGVARRGKVDFDALIADVVANTGWTWDEALDQLTVPRFLALQAEWRAIRPRIGLSPPRSDIARRGDRRPRARQPTIAELKAAFPSGAL